MVSLPKLQRTVPIVDADGKPSLSFHIWFNKYGDSILDALTQLTDQVAAIQAAQDAADAANEAAADATAAAAAADTAATAAQTTADTIVNDQALILSWVSGMIMTGHDAGADASISISAHTRYYGDGTSASVNSGSFTGKAYSTTYYIYYDDAGRTGGAVTYQISTNSNDAVQGGIRHFVGVVTTPAAAAADTSGVGPYPPGIGDVVYF